MAIGFSITRFPLDSTYKQIRDGVLEHTGLKVSCQYITLCKVNHGLIEQEYFNKAKSENAIVPQCPSKKEKAIEEIQKYVVVLLYIRISY